MKIPIVAYKTIAVYKTVEVDDSLLPLLIREKKKLELFIDDVGYGEAHTPNLRYTLNELIKLVETDRFDFKMAKLLPILMTLKTEHDNFDFDLSALKECS